MEAEIKDIIKDVILLKETVDNPILNQIEKKLGKLLPPIKGEFNGDFKDIYIGSSKGSNIA